VPIPNADDVPPMPPDDPIPLIQPVRLPPFPVDAFPDSVADMVNALAEATQTDPAMAG
jgi:replicative DNA helicase